MKSALSFSLFLSLLVSQKSSTNGFYMTPTTTTYVTSSQQSSGFISTSTSLQMAPGGWGIGNPLDFKDEEFSSSSSSKRRRRRRRKDGSSPTTSSGGEVSSSDEVAYNAETTEKIANVFSMEDPQAFSQRVRNERDNLQLQKKKDLMEIAKIAGLGDRMKPKVNRVINNGSDDRFDLEDDDDDLDVRVQWDD